MKIFFSWWAYFPYFLRNFIIPLVSKFSILSFWETSHTHLYVIKDLTVYTHLHWIFCIYNDFSQKFKIGYKGHSIKKRGLLKKSKIRFSFFVVFSEFFLHKYKLCILYWKNYFNLTEIFVLRLFKMGSDQTECWEVQMWNLLKNIWCEWRSIFLPKILTNWLIMDLPQQTWVEKIVHGVETQWLR